MSPPIRCRWATSAAALRTGLLPRWFAWLGILVGIIQLFAIFFFPAFVYWAWILVAAILLLSRPAASTRSIRTRLNVAIDPCATT